MPYKIIKVDEKNKGSLSKLVSSHLEADYNQKDHPDEHFFHNQSIIQNSFNKTKALVATTPTGTLAGFCTFNNKRTKHIPRYCLHH